MEINCPHCSTGLSAPPAAAGKTATCKHCGGRFQIPLPTAVVAELSSSVRPSKAEVITELTSKRYKAIQLIGIAGMLLFVLAFVIGIPLADSHGSYLAMIGVVGMFVSLCTFTVGRGLAWWYHG